MIAPINDDAPRSGQESGASVQISELQHDTARREGPRTSPSWLQRQWPCDYYAAHALAAMAEWEEARALVTEIGLTPQAFADPGASWAAAMLMRPRDLTESEKRSWWDESGLALSWADTVWVLRPRSPEHACHLVRLFAVRTAKEWMGPTLRWCAGRLQAGEPLKHVAPDIDLLLRCVRPSVLGGAA